MDQPWLILKRDLTMVANPPTWFRVIAAVMLRFEATFGGSMMRHAFGRKAQARVRRCLAAFDAMTDEERRHPELIDQGRIERIAAGSGTSLFDAQQAVFLLLIRQRMTTPARMR